MALLPLALIYEPARRIRALRSDAVEGLAQSMGRIGLQTPITVRAASRIRDGRAADVWEIVAGCHRAEAARKLGWTEIETTVTAVDETDARLWALAENLHRAELTVQERAEHIAEWVRLTGEKNKSASCADIPRERGQPQGGINAAVRELGIDRTEAQRSVKIAALSPQAKEAARETGRDNNQSALLAATKVAPEEQARAIREYQPVSRMKPAPDPLNDLETEEQWMTAFMRVWNRGAPQWRERALEAVQSPVFDKTRAA